MKRKPLRFEKVVEHNVVDEFGVFCVLTFLAILMGIFANIALFYGKSSDLYETFVSLTNFLFVAFCVIALILIIGWLSSRDVYYQEIK